jgi:hypothetical protein
LIRFSWRHHFDDELYYWSGFWFDLYLYYKFGCLLFWLQIQIVLKSL